MNIRYNSPVILTFSIVCTAVYLLNLFTGNIFRSLFVLSSEFHIYSISDYLSLFTYTLGHGDLNHLLSNLLFILLLGPIIEEKYGGKRLLFMLAITALATAILYIILFSNQGLIGASGIVFMLIILVSFTNVSKGYIPLTFILIFLLYVGREIYDIFQNDNVSQYAHIAGGIIGGIFGFINNSKH